MPHDTGDNLIELGRPERAVLAGITDPRARAAQPGHLAWQLSAGESLDELARLAETMDYEPCARMLQEREAPDTATYLGKGKVAELKDLVEKEDATCVIIDGVLTGVQARNLEDATGVTVIDRTELILRIFAARARSSEGKVQVELARSRRELTRLSGYGKEMSNQGGGIGTRGPGEQKIEVDRRIIRTRLSRLSQELRKVVRVRAEQRKKRIESGIPVVSLVGYTNAGKSTLFNALTGEEAYADDKLFATLDPWTRKWTLPGGQTVLLVDTVGFIQGLPHELVAAFRATLEESVDADLLVHVVDASSPVWQQQMATVTGVLADLGVEERPRLTVFNKMDRVPKTDLDSMLRQSPGSMAISALNETGLNLLTTIVTKALAGKREVVSWHIPYARWDVLFDIRKVGTVLKERHGDDGATVTCELRPEDVERFSKMLGYRRE